MKTIAKRIIGLVLALAIVAGLVPVTGVLDIEAQAATVNYAPMPNYIQDGVTLHCWNWSIANIRANLGLIANSGYSAIQLSPMQELKETSINKPYDNWWVVYQPISFNLNTKADHAVGTKSELIELCQEAHKYGLKVIMDVVCNHTANGGAANTLCPQVDPDILNDPDCWHDYRTNSWDYSDRYNITQYCMAGLPDLNTGNKKVQQKALDMLKEYIDCGVDGFRWDAAKQIETPNDVYCSSDFWPTVINGANSYASSTRGIYLYNYGELLENADTRNSLHMSAYTQYMSVTESVWSNDVRYKLEDHNAWGLRKEYFKETSADKMVLWAESHDTFGDKSSIYTSQYNLDKAWSLVTSRAYTMALFFPRANDMLYQEMGELAKVSWTSKLTTEVNKFHNHFAGQSECLTQDGNSNLYYNERGNSGIIITNFNDGGRDINIPVYAMANGTYYDQITGNQFTVSGGRLYGAMGDTGVAVVYNPGTKSCSHSSHGSDGYCYSCYTYVGHKSGTICSTCGTASTRTIYFNNTDNWSTPYLYGWHDNGGTGTAGWPGVKMTQVEGTIYKATIPTTATNVIFHNNNGTQTANITPSAKADIYHYNTGFWSSSTGEGEPELDYYLFGWINGTDYGTGDDYANLGQYKFENGVLITSFAKDSYIGIKTNDNTWYMTQGDVTGTSAKFYNTTAGGDGKMLVPGGVQLTFTLKKNMDGTLTLSYSTKICNHSYTSKVTTAAGCTTTGVRTYTCSSCGYSYKETIAAAGHKMSGTLCTVCGYDTACSHNYSSVTNRQPTCTSTGLKTYTCSKCGDSYTQVLSAVAHKYSGGKCSVCGTMDSSYAPDYYLFGYINGDNYACEGDYANLGRYKFVNGKLTATFEQDSYVGVKTSDNANWYMTAGWLGESTSAVLYNSEINTDPNKLFVPGGVSVTFTLVNNGDDSLTLSYTTASCNHSYTGTITCQPTCTTAGVKTYTCSKCSNSYTESIATVSHSYSAGKCTVCGAVDTGYSVNYYLFGYINGANYGCESDYANLGKYQFVNGKLTATFEQDSYVGVKTSDNASWYMTNGWQGEVNSAVLYHTDINANPDKLFVPGGVEVTFTLVNNGNDTLTLSYTTTGGKVPGECSHSYTARVTEATCTSGGYITYVCSNCYDYYTETIPATGHNYVGGWCSTCGAKNPNTTSNEYYLFGYINGANYGCEDDYQNLGQYKCVNGKLTATFDQDSYVAVKTADNAGWYMTNGWQGMDATSVVLYSTDVNTNPDKLYVPGGMEITFTLSNNGNGTLTLSYITAECDHRYLISSSVPATCTTPGSNTFTCVMCSNSYTEPLAATGHNIVAGFCAACGTTQNAITGNDTYYLMGWINGADHGWGNDMNNLGDYRFVDGKLTVTFTEDSYVAVKTADSKFYMTNGYEGEVTSAYLYLFSDPYAASANKILISGGQTVTFTLVENWDGSLCLHYITSSSECKHVYHDQRGICVGCGISVSHTFSNGVCTVCGNVNSDYEAFDYYLFGYINGANYGCENDYANLGQYKFVDGKLTVTFTQDSYVGVKKTYPNGKFGVELLGWYMTEGWQGTDTTSVTLINSNNNANPDKMFVPGGVEVTFTLVNNGNDTLTLSYTTGGRVPEACSHSYSPRVTAATCTTDGYTTYICSKCNDYYTEVIPATGHNIVASFCAACGTTQTGITGNDTYYLMGWINGADQGWGNDMNNLGAYKFVDGKVTVTFTEDSYVAVKTADNKFYMTNGYEGEVTSASLYLFSDPYAASANKLMVSGGQTVTFTLTENWDGNLKISYTTSAATCKHINHNQDGICSTCGTSVEHTYTHGVCSVCGTMDSGYQAYDYYLFGYINGANYGCEEDWQSLGFFKFRSIGTCSANFTSDSYVGVKKVNPGTGEVVGWYMTNGWQGYVSSATLYNTDSLGGNADKLYAPAGVRLTFTLVDNGDGTLSLSYANVNCNHTFDGGVITSQATCGGQGIMTYTCTNCGHYYTETLAAVGHNCVNGKCTLCDAADPNKCCTKHTYTVEYEITSSCTDAGVRSFRASCGATYTVTLPITGHSYNSRVETAATCVLPGVKSYTCSCGDSFSEAIEALGHQFKEGICSTCGANEHSGEVTQNTYYLFGSINGVDYGCGNDWENLGEYMFVGGQLTATFDTDSYIAIKTGDNMNWFMTESYVTSTSATFHNTATGAYEKMFVPGGVRVTFTLTENANGTLSLSYTTSGAGSSVILPSMTLEYPTLSFKDEVKLNIYYSATDLDNVVDMGLIVFSSQVNSYTIYNAESVVSGYKYSTSSGLYTVSTNGIPAKNMGDTIWFAVYAQLSNGTYAYTKLVDYSPRTYAYSLLGSGDAKLDNLLVAMLNYGTAAQTYFGYNTGNLLNNGLANAKSLTSGYDSSMMSDIAAPSAAKQGSFAKNGGFEDMYPSVTFGGAFAINYYCVPSYMPASGVTLYYWREADYNAASVLTPANATGSLQMTGKGTYKGSVTGISAKDIGDGVYVAFVYSDGTTTYCSGVLPYSIGMYCNTMAGYTNDFTPFAQATAVYGYYAKQYFG